MAQYRHVRTGDVITVPEQLSDFYAAKPDWARVLTEQEIEGLKGSALDQTLEDHDLPKSGKADEKRARLAEAQKEN